MSQLENFREQLKRRSRQEEKVCTEKVEQPVGGVLPEEDERKENQGDSPAPKKVRKKKDDRAERGCVWLPKEELRKIKLLSLWIESEGIDGPSTIGDLFVEAVECLIETKYPKVKPFLKRMG